MKKLECKLNRKRITFETASGNFIISQSDGEINNPKLYDDDLPAKKGVLDPFMGLSTVTTNCVNCGLDYINCPGHFGYLKSDELLFHSGYFKKVIHILKSFCFHCGKLLFKVPEKLYSKKIMSFVAQ